MTKKADFTPKPNRRADSLNSTKELEKQLDFGFSTINREDASTDLPRLSSPINREDASPDLPNLDLDADCKLFGDITDC